MKETDDVKRYPTGIIIWSTESAQISHRTDETANYFHKDLFSKLINCIGFFKQFFQDLSIWLNIEASKMRSGDLKLLKCTRPTSLMMSSPYFLV